MEIMHLPPKISKKGEIEGGNQQTRTNEPEIQNMVQFGHEEAGEGWGVFSLSKLVIPPPQSELSLAQKVKKERMIFLHSLIG